MKMYDMGYELETFSPDSTKSHKKSTKYFPDLHIEKAVPEEIMKREIGEACRMEIEGVLTHKLISTGKNGQRKSVTISIRKMGYIGKGGKKTKDEYLKMSDDERDEYDKRDKEI